MRASDTTQSKTLSNETLVILPVGKELQEIQARFGAVYNQVNRDLKLVLTDTYGRTFCFKHDPDYENDIVEDLYAHQY